MIYVAGPLFDPGERWYLEQVDALCRSLGFGTYLPHSDGGLKAGAATDFAAIFAADLAVAVSIEAAKNFFVLFRTVR